MAIGGKRVGAGRKSQWHSPTKMMRLPAKYEQQIADYAKALDSESNSGSSLNDFESKLQQRISSVLLTLPPSQRREAAKLYKKLLNAIG
jgi:hypothetical protein